jgi:hypothetical protein
MPGVDGHHVPRTETIRKAPNFARLGRSAGDRCASPCPRVDQTSPPPIIAIAVAEGGREYLGDELKRQEEGIARNRGRGGKRKQMIVENIERCPQQKPE